MTSRRVADRVHEDLPRHPHDAAEVYAGGLDLGGHASRHEPGGADELIPAWQDFTPTLTASTTDPTLGTGGLIQGRFVQIGGLVTYRFFIQFGSSGANAGDGEYRISVPVDISAENPANDLMAIGQAVLFDWSVAGHKELAVVARQSSTDIKLYVKDATVFHNNPFAWTNDDRFGGEVTYEAA